VETGGITVLDRLLSAGINEARAQRYLAAGAVRLDGHEVSDPATPAAPPSRIVIKAS
jgi:hypothetical protein